MLIKVKKRLPHVFTDDLRQRGLRATGPRLLVLGVLRGISRPLSIQELHQRVGRATLNQATLYRMLKQLTAVGLVRQLNFQQAHARYELNELGKHHHHVVCKSCGDIEDVRLDDRKLVNHVVRQSKFKIQQHSLEFFGLCAQCVTK